MCLVATKLGSLREFISWVDESLDETGQRIPRSYRQFAHHEVPETGNFASGNFSSETLCLKQTVSGWKVDPPNDPNRKCNLCDHSCRLALRLPNFVIRKYDHCNCFAKFNQINGGVTGAGLYLAKFSKKL